MSIGSFDIQTSIMTLSSFRAAPRKGHLERVKRVYGYIAKMKHVVIRIRTGEPDFSGLPKLEFEWEKSFYGVVREIIPKDAPKPLGKYVTGFSLCRCKSHELLANWKVFHRNSKFYQPDPN